jgi:hypothetical protein
MYIQRVWRSPLPPPAVLLLLQFELLRRLPFDLRLILKQLLALRQVLDVLLLEVWQGHLPVPLVQGEPLPVLQQRELPQQQAQMKQQALPMEPLLPDLVKVSGCHCGSYIPETPVG